MTPRPAVIVAIVILRTSRRLGSMWWAGVSITSRKGKRLA